MDDLIINKLDEITSLIDKDDDLIELKRLENNISNNKELLNKISNLKEIDKFDSRYVELKKEILNDKDYKKYTKLEYDLMIFIKQINRELNKLVEKSGCF